MSGNKLVLDKLMAWVRRRPFIALIGLVLMLAGIKSIFSGENSSLFGNPSKTELTIQEFEKSCRDTADASCDGKFVIWEGYLDVKEGAAQIFQLWAAEPKIFESGIIGAFSVSVTGDSDVFGGFSNTGLNDGPQLVEISGYLKNSGELFAITNAKVHNVIADRAATLKRYGEFYEAKLKPLEDEAKRKEIEKTKDAYAAILTRAFSVPRIGSTYSASTSPCYEKMAPEVVVYSPDFFWCEAGFSDLISQELEEEKPIVRQSFKYNDRSELVGVITGLHNVFSSAKEAEEFLKEMYGELGVENEYRQNGYNIPNGGPLLRWESGLTGSVDNWDAIQLAFGCKALPNRSSEYRTIEGNMTVSEAADSTWEGIAGEFIGVASWVSDNELFELIPFEVNIDLRDETGNSRCVVANILSGVRSRTSLGESAARVVEVGIAEVSTTFPYLSTTSNWR